MNFFSRHFSRGLELARNNPQVLYTFFLMIVIPVSFLMSGQMFLQASNTNQERVEKEGIGLMQDSFVSAAADRSGDTVFYNMIIKTLHTKNSDITKFSVSMLEKGRPRIVASTEASAVGKLDVENEGTYKNFQGMMNGQSVIIPTTANGERRWRAYRDIVDPSGAVVGYTMAEVSMKTIDQLAAQGIFSAYLFLIFIVALIFVLLMRQARIIDYTVLYKRLKEVDTMKDDFLSMAAHELRTPLTIIRGYADILSGIKNLEEKDKQNIQNINTSASQLNLLVGDILDVSRLEQGRMKFEMAGLSINDEVKECAASFATLAQGKSLTINLDESPDHPVIMADKERLKQVLTNLIGNAIKYTPAGSVTVRTSFDRIKKSVSIRVSDTGMGISAEDQKGLFSKFYRVRNRETEAIQGTGLGLWITNRIVTDMKGTISVESIKGKGSDFIISFPALISQ